MTGWFDFPTVEMSGRFMASAEYFENDRPMVTGHPAHNGRWLVNSFGTTAREADRNRDAGKVRANASYRR